MGVHTPPRVHPPPQRAPILLAKHGRAYPHNIAQHAEGKERDRENARGVVVYVWCRGWCGSGRSEPGTRSWAYLPEDRAWTHARGETVTPLHHSPALRAHTACPGGSTGRCYLDLIQAQARRLACKSSPYCLRVVDVGGRSAWRPDVCWRGRASDQPGSGGGGRSCR